MCSAAHLTFKAQRGKPRDPHTQVDHHHGGKVWVLNPPMSRADG